MKVGIAVFGIIAVLLADLPEIIRKEKGSKVKKELIAFFVLFTLMITFLAFFLWEET